MRNVAGSRLGLTEIRGHFSSSSISIFQHFLTAATQNCSALLGKLSPRKNANHHVANQGCHVLKSVTNMYNITGYASLTPLTCLNLRFLTLVFLHLSAFTGFHNGPNTSRGPKKTLAFKEMLFRIVLILN